MSDRKAHSKANTKTHTNTHGEAPQGTQSVIRAVRLLKMVASADADTSLTELATKLKLSPPTTHRILAALESEGLLAQDAASRHYSLGPAALTIGAYALNKSDIRALARPMLRHLATTTGEMVTLEIPVEGEMLILDEIAGDQIIGARIEVGTRWPIYATSTGKAYLASLDSADLESELCRERTRFTVATLVNAEALRADLLVARSLGYSSAEGELEAGYAAVGAAVFGSRKRAVAAISIGGPLERFGETIRQRYGAYVMEAALELSNLLQAQRSPL